MNKEFVTYKQSLALKELGFDETCLGNYADNKDHTLFTNGNRPGKTNAPLYQQAFRWFREKYKIEATTSCFYNKRLDIPYEERQYHCFIIRDGVTSKGPKYKTYEEAEQACLDKLIEICKNK